MPQAPSNSIHPKSRAEWRAWLAQNHAQTEGVWLISYKKATGKPRLDYNEAVHLNEHSPALAERYQATQTIRSGFF